MLSNRFIFFFFLGAIVLAWMIPSVWITGGLVRPHLPSSPESPWKANVSVEDVVWGNGSPYIRITLGTLDAPLNISEWSLENELGERAELGVGVELVTPGQTPSPLPLLVASNTTLLVGFGPSPLGVSFREHVCSGYLRGTVPLTPPIETRCPELSKNKSWSALDSSCKLLIESLPRCTVISPEHQSDMNPVCESFLRTVPTYTSCMKEVGKEALLPQWRIFIERRNTFIHQDGGAVILRDDRGMIVDFFPYDTIGLK